MPRLYFDSRRYADLPLHHGKVPPWLAQRMGSLGGAIAESILLEYGHSGLLARLSDPCWFQSFGCVLGMDWHSSGITTSVMGAMKRALNPRFNELGIYVCGGKGNHSRRTPDELRAIGERTGLDADALVRSSKLTAKVDNNAVQDGYQVYLHTFIISKTGEWSVVQQGMNPSTGMARRYHWHSTQFKSYVEEPHTSIYGANEGAILNLTDKRADRVRRSMIDLCTAGPEYVIPEIRRIAMSRHHDVREADVDIKRLGSALALAQQREVRSFESLLELEGVGPRTIQSLALVSEIIHGSPARFTDPARFSFAHGGKDGHPFPVPLNTYDQSIEVLRKAIDKAKLGLTDKKEALKNLHTAVQVIEQQFVPNASFYKVIEQERRDSHKYGGRTVFGPAKAPAARQLDLFE